MNTEKVAALLHPASIAILGARENPPGWTARIFANLVRFGFAGPVYPVNPKRRRRGLRRRRRGRSRATGMSGHRAQRRRLRPGHPPGGLAGGQDAPAGLELALGVQRDPEMGPVVMFGAGGVWLELLHDVAFGPPGIRREQAVRLIDSTRVGRLLDGYRGSGPYDRDAVVDALVAVGRLAAAAGDVIESLDVNPFLALPRGEGGLALDALAVAAGAER